MVDGGGNGYVALTEVWIVQFVEIWYADALWFHGCCGVVEIHFQ